MKSRAFYAATAVVLNAAKSRLLHLPAVDVESVRSKSSKLSFLFSPKPVREPRLAPREILFRLFFAVNSESDVK